MIKNKNNDIKLHLVVGEDIPGDAPKEFGGLVLYTREADGNLKLYAEVDLPYWINYSKFLDYIEDDPRYIFYEGYDPGTGVCRYSCMLKPLGEMRGVYRLGLNLPIKVRSIDLVEEQQIPTEKPHSLVKSSKQ